MNKIKMRTVYIVVIIVVISLSCKREQKWNSESFFEQVFSLIEERSLKKNEVNWVELKQTVKDSIKSFDSNKGVYDAIGYTIKLIDDGHSVFTDPFTPSSLTNDSLLIPNVESAIIDKNIGYIKLRGFIANDSLSNKYMLTVRKSLIELDRRANLSGWILDLRKHNGGRLQNECLGLSPLFEKPLIGISHNNQDSFRNISCQANYFYFGDLKMDSLIYDSQINNRNK